MATTTMSEEVAALARKVAADQIAQDIDNNAKFSLKTDMSDLEQKIIDVCNEVVAGVELREDE